MVLADLIAALEAADPDLVVPIGFENPHSWRGSYFELAFEPVANVTVRSMLEAAHSADGATYEGWKGGDYTMGLHSDVHLADRGCIGEPIGPLLLRYMLGAPPKPVTAERAALEALLSRCEAAAARARLAAKRNQDDDPVFHSENGAARAYEETAKAVREWLGQ